MHSTKLNNNKYCSCTTAALFAEILGFLSSSDLALRNCLLTSDMSVKIGDYGLSHSRYKVGLSFGTVTVV